jgi:hypothetical protein
LPLENMPTPIPSATLVPTSSPTPGQPTRMPEQTATAPSLQSAEVQPVGRIPTPDLAIRMALIPTLLVLAGTLIIQFLYKRRP